MSLHGVGLFLIKLGETFKSSRCKGNLKYIYAVENEFQYGVDV